MHGATLVLVVTNAPGHKNNPEVRSHTFWMRENLPNKITENNSPPGFRQSFCDYGRNDFALRDHVHFSTTYWNKLTGLYLYAHCSSSKGSHTITLRALPLAIRYLDAKLKMSSVSVPQASWVRLIFFSHINQRWFTAHFQVFQYVFQLQDNLRANPQGLGTSLTHQMWTSMKEP